MLRSTRVRHGQRICRGAFQRRLAFVDQVDSPHAQFDLRVLFGRGCRCGELDRLFRATSVSDRSAVAGDRFDRVAITVARREIHVAVHAAGSPAQRRSTTLRVSTNSFQSIALRNRRLAMLWLTET